jgi:hypothetical protein
MRSSAGRTVLVGAAFLAGASLGGCDERAVTFTQTFEAAKKVTNDFAVDVAAGRYEVAYSRLCPPYRTSVPLERFKRSMEKNAYLRGASSVGVFKTSALGGTVTVSGTLRSGAGDATLECHLSDAPAPLCITGLLIGGTPALPAPGE